MSESNENPEKANDLDDWEKLIGKALATQKENYSLGQNYNQVLIAAGYAAYLTLWAKLAPSLPRNIVLLSGGFLGVSLFIFVFYNIIHMLSRALPALDLGKRLQAAESNLEKLIAFENYEAAALKGMGWLVRFWPFIFVSAVGFAAISIFMIIGSAFWGVVYSSH